MSILSRRSGAPRHTARAGRREDGMAFDGDPAADGRTAAEAAAPPVPGSRPVPPSIWDLRSEFYRAAPGAVKTRPDSGPWSTEPFAAIPGDHPGEPGMAEMLEALDARARENTARFYESTGLAGRDYAGRSVAGMPDEVHHEPMYEPQPADLLRKVLDGLRNMDRPAFAADYRDLPMFRGTCRLAGWCGLMRSGSGGWDPPGFGLAAAWDDALARIATWEDEARWDLAATWTGDDPEAVAA